MVLESYTKQNAMPTGMGAANFIAKAQDSFRFKMQMEFHSFVTEFAAMS